MTGLSEICYLCGVKEDGDIVSGFESEMDSGFGTIDFSRASKLERGGSTCDVYVAKLHRRRVFVKRLKEELRSSPRHRAAFDKEFEIGVMLNHRGLPEYREFHGDYIVMDYIDGQTLAEMIEAGDRWLMNTGNLVRMMRELVEIVDYLHQHNVVHSDIKADNIMLTRGTRNVMLIDFDKAYTSWLDDTSGSPALYGLKDDKAGSADFDFCCIGKLVGRLDVSGFPVKNLSKFRKSCLREGVGAEELYEALSVRKNGWLTWAAVATASAVSCCILVILFSGDGFPRESTIERRGLAKVSELLPEMPPRESISVESQTLMPSDSSPGDYRQTIERGMRERLRPVASLIDEGNLMIEDKATPDTVLYNLQSEIMRMEGGIIQTAIADYKRLFPAVEPMAVEIAIGNTRAFQETIRLMENFSGKVSREISRRHTNADAAESRENSSDNHFD